MQTLKESPKTKSPPAIGAKMPDGTIYAGISPTTHQPMYTTPADAPLRMDFNQALEYASKNGFRLPTKEELQVLFENKNRGALRGTFNTTGSYTAGYYWSSTSGNDITAREQRFSDGYEDFDYKTGKLSVRLVRS